MAGPNNILKAECYPETTARPIKPALGMWISRRGHRSPGHHFDGGSLAEILVARSATK
jgi:hypothetical protein